MDRVQGCSSIGRKHALAKDETGESAISITIRGDLAKHTKDAYALVSLGTPVQPGAFPKQGKVRALPLLSCYK